MGDSGCPFCRVDAVLANDLAYARSDQYPVTPGHLLIIPKRHVRTWFDLTDAERRAVDNLLFQAREWLVARHQPDGFNIGMNCGEAAGQTVLHVHCHLIPRYHGDSEDPRGGVRGVIPDRQRYD
ncbi:HIT family protein [Salinisphaera orenii]|uniref:HIT family protein n=1 Tax=Salinisphaera orenii TaxID=856731 RepID=UPI000DBE6ABF